MRFGDQVLKLEGRKVNLARVISRLTAAPVFNLYVALLIAFTSPIGLGPLLGPIELVFICVLTMVILPISPILFSAWRGHVDLDVSRREHRGRYFLFSIACYVLAYTVYSLTQCTVMAILAAAYIFVTSGVTLANHFTKVSVHATGVSGPGTALIWMYGIVALLVVPIWFLVVWSRMTLKQHSLEQGLLGLFIGIVITLVVYTSLYPVA